MSIRKPTRTLNNEVLTALCRQCNCCLASTTHCWTEHSNIPIDELCGCGTCQSQVNDFNERDAIRIRNRQINFTSRARIR